MKLLSLCLALICVVVPRFTALAYDFEALTASGTRVYYNILSEENATVAVTYRDTQYNSYSGSVTLDSGVEYGGQYYNVVAVGTSAFRGCSSLTDISIPATVTKIGSDKYNVSGYVFHGCTALKQVRFDDGESSLTLGPDYYVGQTSSKNIPMFGQCQLERLYIGRDITFPSYSGYEQLYAPFSGQQGDLMVTVGSGVTIIAPYSFYGCTSLSDVNMSCCPKLATIGKYAFYNCKSLTGITIPATVTAIGNGVARSSNYVFHGCESLRKIVIEDSPEPLMCGLDYYSGVNSTSSLGTFRRTAVEEVYIGRQLTFPGEDDSNSEYCAPFSYCTTLDRVTFGEGAVSVPPHCFDMCENLRWVKIGDGTRKIGKSVFSGCASLQAIKIGENLSELGDYAFFGCSNLGSIRIAARCAPLCGTGAFAGVNCEKCRLYIPAGYRDEYTEVDYWQDFLNMSEYDVAESDVNADGVLNISDVGCVINVIIGVEDGAEAQVCADVSNDNTVNMSDVGILLNKITGIR